MRTIALTQSPQIEVISAFSAANQQVPAVNGASGWFVIGSFYIPITSLVKLEVVGLVSDAGLTMNVRLFDMTSAAPVSGTAVDVTALVDQRVVSGRVELAGGRLYQFQAQALSASNVFGVVKSAALI